MVAVMDLEKLLPLKPKQPLYVLSPHLDDAMWSLGVILQELAAGGHPVQVITIFSDTTQTTIRKAEDNNVLSNAGCLATHLDFSDAVLDGRPVADVFDETYIPQAEVAERIARRVQDLLPAKATVLAPSGFGVHVDHLTTRSVAELLEAHVVYYEDLPYAARDVRLANAQAFFASRQLHRQPITTNPTLIDEHIRLYNLYKSQRQDHHVVQIRTYLSRVGFGVWL